ncbi:MAG: glycosyltransferase family 4 protein [Ardenticatenales bacterium]|nr:glycosyltransferase family 4 protein [Ardenticatenales bacterium]
MKAQIAIDGTSALAQGGGIGRFTRGLLQGLAACDQETSYEILYMRDAATVARFDLPANFRWQSIPLTQKQAVWLWHRLHLPLPVELWLKQRPALFHSPDYTLPPLRWARGIVTVHDLSFEVLPEVHDPKLRRYLQQAVPRSIRRADHVFADSESTRAEILRHYGTSPDKISVVYPGVEPRFRPLSREQPEEARLLDEVRTRYKLERPFLLSVGTLEPRKNLATLIRAFASYRATGEKQVMLVIAGGAAGLGSASRWRPS